MGSRPFSGVPKSYAAGLEMHCPGGALYQPRSLKFPVRNKEQSPCHYSGVSLISHSSALAATSTCNRTGTRCMQDDFACLHYGLAWIRIRVFRIVAVLRWGHRGSWSRCPSTFLQTNPVGRVRRLGFCASGNIPPTVIPWLNSVCGPGGNDAAVD
jgi:hypothetical protein